MMHWNSLHTDPPKIFWTWDLRDPSQSHLPLLVTSGGHHWRPVQFYSLQDSPMELTSGGCCSRYSQRKLAVCNLLECFLVWFYFIWLIFPVSGINLYYVIYLILYHKFKVSQKVCIDISNQIYKLWFIVKKYQYDPNQIKTRQDSIPVGCVPATSIGHH